MYLLKFKLSKVKLSFSLQLAHVPDDCCVSTKHRQCHHHRKAHWTVLFKGIHHQSPFNTTEEERELQKGLQLRYNYGALPPLHNSASPIMANVQQMPVFSYMILNVRVIFTTKYEDVQCSYNNHTKLSLACKIIVEKLNCQKGSTGEFSSGNDSLFLFSGWLVFYL